MTNKQSLGRAVTIMVRFYQWEQEVHDDAFPPSVCHDDNPYNFYRRKRDAERHACHVAGVRDMRRLRERLQQMGLTTRCMHRRYGFTV